MKNSKFKKVLGLMMVGVLAGGIFSGCSSEKNTSVETNSSTTEVKEEAKDKTKEETKESKPAGVPQITWYQQNNSAGQFTNMGESECYKVMEETLGVDIVWQHPADGSNANEQINLMIAAGDLPDVVFWNWEDMPGGPAKYINEKVIRPINDLVEEHASNYLKKLEERAGVKEMAYLDDGTMPGVYGMATPDDSTRANPGLMIRQDWLTKLGLEQPTNIEEWETVLRAFKTQDPNGDGKNDEIPWVDQKGSNLNAFTPAFGILPEFYVDPATGSIAYGPVRPEYKEFLMTMNKWYEEGLIDPEYVTNDGKMYSSKIVSSQAGATFGYISSTLGNLTAQGRQTNPDFTLKAVPHPATKEGKSYNAVRGYTKSITEMAAISMNCKMPEVALKVLDYGYSEEGINLLNWGIEGKSYEVVDGKKQFTDAILNPSEGKTPAQAIIQYAYPIAGWSKEMENDAYKLAFMQDGQLDALATWSQADSSLLIPWKARLNAQESSTVGTIMNEIKTYQDEMILKFIMGNASVEEEFDKYVENINKMGIEEAIQMWQQAYDRVK